MKSSSLTRRRFLAQTAAATVLSCVPPVLGKDTDVEQNGESYIRVLLHGPDGNPLDPKARHLHARDLPNDTLPQAVHSAEGRARIALAKEPIQLSCSLAVPGFGEVFCYADNEGKGYRKPGNVEFVVEAAKTRLRRVRESYHRLRHGGDPELDKHLEAAARPIPKRAGAEQIAAAYESLAHGLHAGERLSLVAARARISRMAQPRKEFLFGGPGFRWQMGGEFEKYFLQLFNYSVNSWYTWGPEQPESQQISYVRSDQSLDWALKHNLTVKGFGYCYMTPGATPEWIRSWPYEKVLPEYKRVVRQTTQRYDRRFTHVEVINEAHDKANLFQLSHAQIVEITRETLKAAREGSATVKRQINNCCLWGNHSNKLNADGSRRWTPFRYLADCVSGGCEFETIGLQLYYPQQDMFEIERMVDRFKVFKKRLHISEISCNSAPGLDPSSMRAKDLVPGWHGPWTEGMQADWLESIYTICYSKPEFEAVGYWDFADYGGHFWPNGGLLRKDLTPKESYGRLLNLQKAWGLKA
jgi:endo-1,4-beta-xylanase